MAKKSKKNTKDIKNKITQTDVEKWLLGFEKQIGKPVVVSLLIEEGDINFISCVRKRVYLGLHNDDDYEEGEPTIDLKKAKKEINSLHLEYGSYIG